jgi:predicted Fe-Mo cluster-binding NifX family protein
MLLYVSPILGVQHESDYKLFGIGDLLNLLTSSGKEEYHLKIHYQYQKELPMKIAVPVHDEKREIFVRVGRAPWFAIFDDGVFAELRPNRHTHEHAHEGGPHDGGHGHGRGGGGHGQGRGHGRRSGNHGRGFGAEDFEAGEEPMDTYSAAEVELHRKDLENLSDVDVMLARAVGPNMKEALELSGIRVVRIRKRDGERADDAVRNFLDSPERS